MILTELTTRNICDRTVAVLAGAFVVNTRHHRTVSEAVTDLLAGILRAIAALPIRYYDDISGRRPEHHCRVEQVSQGRCGIKRHADTGKQEGNRIFQLVHQHFVFRVRSIAVLVTVSAGVIRRQGNREPAAALQDVRVIRAVPHVAHRLIGHADNGIGHAEIGR